MTVDSDVLMFVKGLIIIQSLVSVWCILVGYYILSQIYNKQIILKAPTKNRVDNKFPMFHWL